MSPTARGIAAALRTLVLTVCGLAIAIPVLRVGADWWVRRTIDVGAPNVVATTPTVGVVVSGTPQERATVIESLARLRLPHLPTLHIAVGRQAEPGIFIPADRQIVIDRSVVGDPLELQATLAHEVGHAVDSVYLDAASRRRFERFRHMPQLGWRSFDLPWARRPEEDFAECFSAVSQPFVIGNIATAYGNIDAAAFERFLGRAGIVLPPPTPPANYVEAIRRELIYDAEMLGYGVGRLTILGILMAETALLMYGSYRRASVPRSAPTVLLRRVRTRHTDRPAAAAARAHPPLPARASPVRRRGPAPPPTARR